MALVGDRRCQLALPACRGRPAAETTALRILAALPSSSRWGYSSTHDARHCAAVSWAAGHLQTLLKPARALRPWCGSPWVAA